MQHHRSIGLTDLVALMAAHRAAARHPLRPGQLDEGGVARISAYLRDEELPSGDAPPPRSGARPSAAAEPRPAR
ncbi:hypothetical protein [Roseomonas sp. BN140053]|uniref:hypothetical protein n=1 Tax=Roseomonas sp. BN140053 TaxID=3391898 RepID=UPI0039E81E33